MTIVKALILIPMLWVHGHYKLFAPSVRVSSINVRFWRLKSVPALERLNHADKIKSTMKTSQWKNLHWFVSLGSALKTNELFCEALWKLWGPDKCRLSRPDVVPGQGVFCQFPMSFPAGKPVAGSRADCGPAGWGWRCQGHPEGCPPGRELASGAPGSHTVRPSAC